MTAGASSRSAFWWRASAGGFGFYGQSVYLAELHRDQNWPASLISGATTFFYLFGAVIVVFVAAAVRGLYARVIEPSKLLTLPESYKADYARHDPAGDAAGKGKGPGPARNYAWDVSIAEDHGWQIRDDIPTGQYNEDTDLSLMALKGGCSTRFSR